MNRLTQLFESKKDNILNIYFTAGYPNLEDTSTIIKNLATAGVDLIEVGMPYSDPLADGPTIQESGQRALQNGMTLDLLFDQLKTTRQYTEIPLVLMGYFNQVMQYGPDRFFKACADAGVDGLILPDLPLEVYREDYQELMAAHGLQISFLITPQTEDSRIRLVDELSTSFVYMVSSASITGAKQGIENTQVAYFERIAAMDLQRPRLIGFGISNHDTFSTACRYARGAIIGSAFIRALTNTDDVAGTCHDFVAMIRNTALKTTV